MLQTNKVRIQIATGDALDVRGFSVQQAMNRLFGVELFAVASNGDIDFDAVVGAEAAFDLQSGSSTLRFTGVVKELELVRSESGGLSSYRVHLVPRLWLTTQRTNRRVFQYLSELAIVEQMLHEWGVPFLRRVDPEKHTPRKYRVQYDESDFAFMSRMLEDAGINYYFEASDDGESQLVLDDGPELRRLSRPLVPFHDRPGVTSGDFVTSLTVRSRLRPGKISMGDLDYRRPSTMQPTANHATGRLTEQRLEHYDYEPGTFLYASGAGERSPTADDRGAARTDLGIGSLKAKNRLAALRNDARAVSFESNVLTLAPGVVLSIAGHPHPLVSPAAELLVTEVELSGTHDEDWRVRVEAAPTSVPYRPKLTTPKPRAKGLESATVVGPAGEEIHTDEFGRVRVHFHWDRDSKRDETSSCWLPTNQPWAGQGFGGVNIPRVGQEVLVEFLAGDPDRPVVVGRVYTESNPVPAPLPRFKNVSGIMSESTPRVVMGGSGGSTGQARSIFGGTPMSPQDIANQVTNAGIHQANSPTGAAHQWQGSGLQIDDTSGAENLYLQANKDMNWVVRNDWRTVVGNHRAAFIGTDDMLHVRGSQEIRIGVDQQQLVQRDQGTQVYGDRTDSVAVKFTQVVSKGVKVESRGQTLAISSDDTISFRAPEGIELKVGSSSIKIQNELIRIDGGDSKVHINPSFHSPTYVSAAPFPSRW